jgi:zinc protease
MTVATVSDKMFGHEVLGAAIPVLVEFTAEHAPVNAALDELANEMQGRVRIVTVDIDRNPTLKDDYGVRGLPALILFKHGKPVSRRVGSLSSKAELVEWIDGALILALATRRTSAARSASEFKLANGLHLVVVPDHRMPVVTQTTLYKVGEADEPKDFAGLATLLMNLSFKSVNKIDNNGIATIVARTGGETNASCGRSATLFWHRSPRADLKSAMELEADRMADLRITEDEAQIERNVVLENRRLGIDIEPAARLAEKINGALYRAHTYRSPPGDLANEIMHLSRLDVVRFHQQYYAPNNAIVVISGDVTPEETHQLAVAIYGRIPKGPKIGKQGRGATVQPTSARITLEDTRSNAACFRRSYAVPAYGSAHAGEAEALEVLTYILAGGFDSRLFRKLVIEDQIASDVSGKYSCNAADAGTIALSAYANAGDPQDVEGAMDVAIEDIRKNGVNQAELRCAKKTLVANYIYMGADQVDLTRRYATALALGRSIKDVEDWATAFSRVSASDVWKVAKTYVVERRSVTGWLYPKRKI